MPARGRGARRLIGVALGFFLYVLIPTVAFARGGGGNHSSGGGSFGGSGFSGGGYYGGGSSYYGGGTSGGIPIGGPIGIVLAIAVFGVFGVIALFALRSLFRNDAPQAAAASYQYGSGNYGALAGTQVNSAPAAGALTGSPVNAAQPAPGIAGAPPALQAAPAAMAPAPASAPAQKGGLAGIMDADPGFNRQQFLDRCQAAFFQLQKCWMDRNVDEGRAYMSSGLYSTWSMQVQQMVTQHKHDVMEDLFVQGMRIVAATHDQNFDTVSVRIDASCKDYEVDDNTGKTVFGDKQDRPWTEFWTFQRSAGAKTLVSGGVIEKKCPNCGAPLSVNQNGSCTYCNAPVTSGKFDWVLTRIDQENEWTGMR